MPSHMRNGSKLSKFVTCKRLSTVWRACADESLLGRMLALKRGPALLDHTGKDMPLTRSVKQRTQEDEHAGICDRLFLEGCLQLEGKELPSTTPLSLKLSADGSSAALRLSKVSSSANDIEIASSAVPAVIRASITAETTKHACHAEHGCVDGGWPEDRGVNSSPAENKEAKGQPELPALLCKTPSSSEIPQSPRRTRSQEQWSASLSRASSLTDEARLYSSATHECSQQQETTHEPYSSSQEPKSPRIRRNRITLTVGAKDGACTSSRAAVTDLKSCMRKESALGGSSQTIWCAIPAQCRICKKPCHAWLDATGIWPSTVALQATAHIIIAMHAVTSTGSSGSHVTYAQLRIRVCMP